MVEATQQNKLDNSSTLHQNLKESMKINLMSQRTYSFSRGKEYGKKIVLFFF